MAKLGAYYGLCPLIDQRNLLGVTDDSEIGHVIVTLGKNISIKYRLSDQKQIHSWRTKDKFSSPVIYDNETNQYVAVFNYVYIRVWKGDEEYVDKLKKYKFNKPIHTLTKCNNKAFVVFKNGDVTPLNFAIENRKDLGTEAANTENDDADVLTVSLKNDILIGVLLRSNGANYFIWTVFSERNKETHKIELTRENVELVGQVLNQTENQHGVHLLSIWSDGKLYSYPIYTQNEMDTPIQVESPGNLFALVESLSCKSPITMAALNHHYIAMYGADPNQEGAALILYNTQFKVSQSKQPLKLFTSGAKLWHIEDNILLSVGQNLAVIPFHLDTEQLAALVGSHRTALNDLDPDITIVEKMEITNWNLGPSVEVPDPHKSIPMRIKTKVLEYSKQGLSEAIICQEIIPEFIEKEDIDSISTCLGYFCDIPELCLAKLLKFCLVADDKLFKNTQPISSSSLPTNLQPLDRCMLLDKILMCSFSDIILLPHIRTHLDLTSTLLLLQYICYLMTEDGHSLPLLNITESENKLIEWGCLLLDANYQKFLLSRDDKILEVLSFYSKLVGDYLNSLESMRQVAPLLIEIKKGNELIKHKQMADCRYSIEQLSLY